MLHAPESTRFVTTDPDEGSARVAEVYADNRLRVRGEREHFYFEQSREDLGDLRFDTFSNTLTADYTVDPLGHVIIVRMLDHEMDIWTDGTHRRLGPGDTALLAHPDHAYSTRLHGASMELVGVELPLLYDADEPGAQRARDLRFDPLDPARANSWRRTVDYVTATALDSRAQQSPLVIGTAARHLAAALLAAFGVPGAEQPGADVARVAPAVLRRAMAYCDAHPDADLGVADIARACHVSVRTLQAAFRRHLDTTPMAYLRRVRLDRVRRDLTASDPSVATVAAVAARWGFADASRFSAQYRATFGESPGATLKRG
ncbi:helix-turn-helix domain-containing protein [Nocardioides humilatus]|nr:AraC family transcriptional regulator [Nocardioides humilatus]